MGIYDRDYYRKEGPSYLDLLVPSGAVCKWLIGINLVVFLVQIIIQSQWGVISFQRQWSRFDDALMLQTERVYEGEVWRVLTHAFLHGDFWHLFFNMLFLWWFGSKLEEWYGAKEFLAFYLTAALAGGAAYMIHGAFSPRVYMSPALGASGAITGLLLLYAFRWPRDVILLMMIVPVPIWLFVVFNIGKDLAGLFETDSRVAVAGHLGGAAFAGLYYQFEWHITGLFRGLKNWWKQRRRPKLRIWRPEEGKEPVPVGAGRTSDVDEHLEAKVDAVLEKVARSGQSSLTEQEKQILLRASEIYKKRRT
jgi:membrane associated rhomboid family serine protease